MAIATLTPEERGETPRARARRPAPHPQEHLLRRRRRPVDLRLARRRGRQHPALRARLSRRQGHPARAQLPLDRATSSPPPRTSSPTTRAGSARRCAPRTCRARRCTVTGCWDSEEEARAIGEEIEQLQRKTARHRTLDEIAILVRASFQMREFEDRFVTLGLPYRVIGGPRFYERQEIRDALAYLRVIALSRPTTSPSSASSTCPSAGSATPPCSSCTTMRASAASR